MIDFEEELKKFKPSLDLTDLTDILQEMIREARRNR